MKAFRFIALVCLMLVPSLALAQAPTPLPGYNISLAAGYTSTSGNQTNNGMWASAAVPMYTFKSAFAKPWDMSLSGRGDYFTLKSPQNYVVTGGPEFRFQVSKPSFLNGAVFQPFANLGLGVTRAQCVSLNSCATGADQGSHFTVKVGGGIDIPVSSTMSLRLIEIDILHASPFPNGNLFISNLAQFSTGLKLTF